MGSYKKIGLSHEMGLIDTPPLGKFREFLFERNCKLVFITIFTKQNNFWRFSVCSLRKETLLILGPVLKETFKLACTKVQRAIAVI